MKIYVTQGHENGIGIEIFLKSFAVLSKTKKERIFFIGYRSSLLKTLSDCKIPDIVIRDLNIIEPDSFVFSESLSALLTGMKLATAHDILITQPTTKDQLFFDNKHHLGHTEFFRYYYQNKNIPMSFIGLKNNTMLLTDHTALKDVVLLQSQDIVERVEMALNGFQVLKNNIQHIYFSGINPHAGENGLLGSEDQVIIKAAQLLKNKFPHLHFHGPLSGDTLHLNKGEHSLLVYAYHDQGLAFFKSQNGLLGINTTFGLPFLRLSVDHGTAFNLYGKNLADFSSMMFLFDFVFKV
ncbi:MAG: 4-hydroxythreonine-4-phosphate dehydrogenase PdxA [Bacteriovoracaceae bacterium]|nr:4-hydroxythreonine-4-phosphate dehydrogenase PdxA [Bacteriovoracaceae bacterium]